jgi:hypothetical protein
MIEHFINGKSTGIIDQDNKINRDNAIKFMANYNNHYKTKHVITFKAFPYIKNTK